MRRGAESMSDIDLVIAPRHGCVLSGGGCWKEVGKKGCCQASFFGPQNQDGFETFELKTSDKH